MFLIACGLLDWFLKNRNFVRKHKRIPRPALCARDSFVEAKKGHVRPKLHLPPLRCRGLVFNDNINVIKEIQKLLGNRTNPPVNHIFKFFSTEILYFFHTGGAQSFLSNALNPLPRKAVSAKVSVGRGSLEHRLAKLQTLNNRRRAGNKTFFLGRFFATNRAIYAAERSTFVASFPENAPPPCGARPQ